MSKVTFTLEQQAQFKAYEKVRSKGKYNMYDPRAQQAASLTREQMLFVMENYSELKELVEAKA